MKKGFTLIELLAVLVILAIIALIVVPIIQSIIKDSKKSAAIRSAELYIDAINQTIASNNFDIADGTYNIDENGNLCLDDACSETLTVKVEKSTPKLGSVQIEDARVVSVSDLYFEKQKFYISTEDGKLEAQTKMNKKYEPGEIVYFDVSKGTSCTESEYDSSFGNYEVSSTYFPSMEVEDYGNSLIGYNGIDNKNSKQNSCLKFYVIGSTKNKVNLILDHNTTITIGWNGALDNATTGPNSDFLNELKDDTKEWNGTLTPTNYTNNIERQCYNNICNDGFSYTINYTGYKARIISMEEILNIMGITSFNHKKIVDFWGTIDFSDYNTTTSEIASKNSWLFDRIGLTDYGLDENGFSGGYYTQSAGLYIPTYSMNPSIISTVWKVKKNALRHTSPRGNVGIRPVIEVSKDNLE